MKKEFPQTIKVIALMVAVLVVSVALTAITGTVGPAKKGKTVVTTVYPLYVAVENIADGVAGVTVENLTGSATGCLHDYQLSPANRITLQQADLLICNGAGAESFLDDVIGQLTATVIDTDEGVDLLEGHEHHHEDDEDDEDKESEHSHENGNEHLWTSPHRYAQQVETITEALCRYDSVNAVAYRENGQAYLKKIQAVEDRLTALAEKSAGTTCLIFHDSLAYLAADLGWTVAASLPVGEETGVSAGDLATAERVLAERPDAFLLYDSQYTVRFSNLDIAAMKNHVLTVNTAVRGTGRLTDWLDAMEENLTALEKVIA